MKNTYKVIYRGEWRSINGKPTTRQCTWEANNLAEALIEIGWGNVIRAYENGKKMEREKVEAATKIAERNWNAMW